MDKFYITTSIVYTNGPPHVGFAIELVQADVIARFNRKKGKQVFFLTGTDEHGLKIEKKAKEEGESPQKFVDGITSEYKELLKSLNISNNSFIRTTDQKRHWPSVRKIWEKLKDNGDIYKKEYRGFYCTGCEAFLRKKDLENDKCLYHDCVPEEIKEENYFFRLSRYQEKIKEAITTEKVRIIPQERKRETLSFIEEGLEDISISRSKETLQWGIPVPGDESQVLYVWLDALSNYISALNYAEEGEDFKKFWPADVHCVGKDILRFHSVMWIGMLLSAELSLPKNILVHGFIGVEGKRMSKSLGNVVDPFDLVSRYGGDSFRYFFLREIPTTKDGDFSEKRIKERYNTDLADGLGNLTSRTIALAERKKISFEPSAVSHDVIKKIEESKKESTAFLEEFKFNEALNSIWNLIHFTDRYVEEKKPWESNEDSIQVIQNLLFVLSSLSEMLYPFMPETSEKIKKQIKERRKDTLFPKTKDI